MLPATLSPSMMCADIFDLTGCLAAFAARGVPFLHIDVMDGVFVPNYCLGTDYIRRLREKTRIPMDIHLMVAEPEKKLGAFTLCPGDAVSVHLESTADPAAALRMIRDAGASPFLAVNPGTPVQAAAPFVKLLDGVLLMTVYPGFAGQPMAAGSYARISALRVLLDKAGRPNAHIEVDGCVSFEKAPRMRLAGADRFVAGTSSVFGPGGVGENTDRLCRLLAAADEEAVRAVNA